MTRVLTGRDARSLLEIATGVQPKRRQHPEEDMQIQVMEALIGKCGPGPREIGGGLSAKYPELYLVRGSLEGIAKSKAQAGRAKAAGMMTDYPDLHLPVMRGPFLSLFVELKVPGKHMRPGQKRLAELLRLEGNCVIESRSVDHAVSVFAGYLALPMNRPSIRPIAGFSGKIEDGISRWRQECHLMLAESSPYPVEMPF